MTTDLERNGPHKNIRALFILWAVVSVVAALGGGAIFLGYYYHAPHGQMPAWRFGQILMFYGIVNLGMMIALKWQMKK